MPLLTTLKLVAQVHNDCLHETLYKLVINDRDQT